MIVYHTFYKVKSNIKIFTTYYLIMDLSIMIDIHIG